MPRSISFLPGKPFLKWAGNKYPIVERIKQVLPPGKRLVEPFAGSGAVFLNTNYSNYLLADSNPILINLFNFIKNEGLLFIEYCKNFFRPEFNTRETYYQLREKFNSTDDSRLKAALFLYLNRHCYNGLCRFNARAQFNTPYGRYKKPYFPELELVSFYEKSQLAEFRISDYLTTMQNAEYGDVIYCDPPYAPLSHSANFTQYHVSGFTLDQQSALVQLAEKLAANDIPVIISNHDTEYINQLYGNANINRFAVQRFISCKGNRRAVVGEVLAVFMKA